MAELVGAINGANNANRDAHFAAAASHVLTQGAVSGLVVSETSVSAGIALVSITRTSVSPAETFLVPFYLTAAKTISTGANKKIYVRIDAAKVNDPAQITDPLGAGVGSVEVGASWPAGNYVKLAETNGSGVVSTSTREVSSFRALPRRGITPGMMFVSDGEGGETEVSLGSAGMSLLSNGPDDAPYFGFPTVARISGEIIPWPSLVVPTGWLKCDGAAYSRATYPTLFSTLCPGLSNPTISIASPGVITSANHGLADGTPVFLTTTGALPTGFTANTIYWVKSPTTNTFQLSTTSGGSAINTSGSQSGTHSLFLSSWGNGDGTTTFNVPNLKGRVLVGLDSAQTEFDSIADSGGAKTHTLSIGEMPSHSHNIQRPSGAAVSSGYMLSNQTYDGAAVYQATQTAGSGQAHNNLQPYITIQYIIKT